MDEKVGDSFIKPQGSGQVRFAKSHDIRRSAVKEVADDLIIGKILFIN